MNVARVVLVIAGEAAHAIASVEATEKVLGHLETRLRHVALAADATTAGLGRLSSSSAAAGVAAAAAAAAFFSLKEATNFEMQMTRLHTQADVAKEDLPAIGNAALDMAGKVGIAAGNLIRDGYYHAASAGFDVKNSLETMEYAAKLAKIGFSDLSITTQAVVGTLAAFQKQGMTAAEAAAEINATVGTGDMTMEKFAKALGSGVLSTASQFGLTFKDVASAIATTTDNVTPADEAATRLRMTISLLGAETDKAKKALNSIGLSQFQLAEDMRKGGLQLAVHDLAEHLHKLGPDQAQLIISQAFGGAKSGGEIRLLIDQIERLDSKYKTIQTGPAAIAKFNADWAERTKDFNFQLDQTGAKLNTASIKAGNFLKPAAAEALHAFNDAFDKIVKRVQDDFPKAWDTATKMAKEAIGALQQTPVWKELDKMIDRLKKSFDPGHEGTPTDDDPAGLKTAKRAGLGARILRQTGELASFALNPDLTVEKTSGNREGWAPQTDRGGGTLHRLHDLLQGIGVPLDQIADGFRRAYKAAEPFINFIVTQGKEIKKSFDLVGISWALKDLQKQFNDLGPAVEQFKEVMSGLGKLLGGVIGLALMIVAALLLGLAKAFAESSGVLLIAFGGLFKIFKGIAEVLLGVFGGIFLLIYDITTGQFGKLVKDVMRSGELLDKGLKDIFVGLFQFIVGLVGFVVSFVVNLIIKFVSSFIELAQFLYDRLVGHSIIPDLVNGIIDWFAKLPERVLEFIQKLASGVLDKLHTLATDALNKAKEIGKAITDGIVQGFGDIGKALGGIIDAGKQWVKDHTIDSHSPSKVFAEEVGAPISEGIAEGILNRHLLIRNAMSAVLDPNGMALGRYLGGALPAGAQPIVNVYIGNEQIDAHIDRRAASSMSRVFNPI